MLNTPEAMFRIIIGMRKGEMRPGPLFISTVCCSSWVWRPPMPEPMKAPIWSRSSFSKSMPES